MCKGLQTDASDLALSVCQLDLQYFLHDDH